jgi:hypothetical protein
MVMIKDLEGIWREVVLSWDLPEGTEKTAKNLLVIIAEI